MADHLAAAARIADVPWLAASRRAYRNWPVRLGAVGTGAVLLAASLQPGLPAAAVTVLAVVGTLVAATGLVMGARYGRILGGLLGALEAGYPATWLTARVGLHEGDAASLAAELDALACRQPAR
jgi:hypothetical protein